MAESLEEDCFEDATRFVRGIIGKLSEKQLLDFYGLYKQAMDGPCTKPKPSWFKMTEKQKWEAWIGYKDLSRASARKLYVEILTKIAPDWRETETNESQSWVRHSCLLNDDDEITDECKTIFDWVKENEVLKVQEMLKDHIVDVNALDEDGLSLLHWASDRGSLEMVQILFENSADVNCKDQEGQTPLHFASSCGHCEVVHFLLKAGADLKITDNEDHDPYSVANNSQIEAVFKDFM